MKIEKIYVYPVKSLRGIEVDSATLTKHGFPYDRTFCLLQVHDESGVKSYKNMSVANYNEMVRFFPSFNEGEESITITYYPIDNSDSKTIEIPLKPDTSKLEEIDIMMHLSPTKAFKMDSKYNEFLSDCFGYECILAYISDNLREVRMSTNGSTTTTNGQQNRAGWLSSITTKAAQLITGTETPSQVNSIRFSDVAPYLFVSRKSMEDVDHRLPEGEVFDITKFRPNVIVSGAEQPWDEDFWGELTIGDGKKVEVEHNCGRCRSINIDYETGAQGTGEAGKMLKFLNKDRRVDKGTKWVSCSPYATSLTEWVGLALTLVLFCSLRCLDDMHFCILIVKVLRLRLVRRLKLVDGMRRGLLLVCFMSCDYLLSFYSLTTS